MSDAHDKKTRSYNMSRIKDHDTKPEILVRKYLHRKGFRFKLHDKSLPGGPDIVLPKYKTIIFVNGCFFHGHVDCNYYRMLSLVEIFGTKKSQIIKVETLRLSNYCRRKDGML